MESWNTLVHAYLENLQIYNQNKNTFVVYRNHLLRILEHLEEVPLDTCENRGYSTSLLNCSKAT